MQGSPGIAASFQDRLREIVQRERRYDLVATYRAKDCFDHPSSANYDELRKAAEKINCWPTVRAAALRHLETGQRPAPDDRKDEISA